MPKFRMPHQPLLFSAFWWVKNVDNDEPTNMRWVKVTHNNFDFMIMENSSALRRFEKLIIKDVGVNARPKPKAAAPKEPASKKPRKA